MQEVAAKGRIKTQGSKSKERSKFKAQWPSTSGHHTDLPDIDLSLDFGF
jgi:hypothetical protein